MYDWLFAHTIVPEPASLLLIVIAGVMMPARGKRRPA
jgi:hypothetical protein